MAKYQEEAPKDAWEQLENLRKRFTKNWDFREDLHVLADGTERGVCLNGTPHNVGTIREYIQILSEACDFVDAANPEWASHHTAVTTGELLWRQ